MGCFIENFEKPNNCFNCPFHCQCESFDLAMITKKSYQTNFITPPAHCPIIDADIVISLKNHFKFNELQKERILEYLINNNNEFYESIEQLVEKITIIANTPRTADDLISR